MDEGEDTSLLPYKFTGKIQDEETSLMYYGARYYDPKISNWISTDPALPEYLPTGAQLYFPEQAFNANSLKGSGGVFNSENLASYTYVHQNPVKLVDPNGKMPALAIPLVEETTATGAGIGTALGGPVGMVIGGAIGLGLGLYLSYKVGQALDNIATKMVSKENDSSATESDGDKVKLKDLTGNISDIANKTGLTTKEVKEKIHELKQNLPKDKSQSNPDVKVGTKTGEVYPETKDGKLGDSIGNIHD